jgi:Protein of unknown function (DUF2786)
MNKSDIAAKIKKLLNRNGRTEAEADTATILAAALADKHGIDIAALEQQENDRAQEIMEKCVGEWFAEPCEACFAALICSSFFEVETLVIQGYSERRVFIGTPMHVEIAQYIFGFLLKEFRWQWNRRRGRSRKRSVFIYGCFVALSRKLEDRFQPPEQPAQMELSLMVSLRARRQAFLKQKYPGTTSSLITPKNMSGVSLQNGIRAGHDIEIRQGLNGSKENGRPALTLPNTRFLQQ